MTCSTVWNQSCLSLSCANTSSSSQKEPVLWWTPGQHISGISHLFHQLSIASSCLSWPAGQKEASAKGSKSAAAQGAGAGRGSTTSRPCLLHFPFGFLCLLQCVARTSFCSSWISRTLRCHWEQGCATSQTDWWLIALLHSKSVWGDCVCLSFIIWSLHVRDKLTGHL